MHGSKTLAVEILLSSTSHALTLQVFICEFEELHSPLRDATTQGGGVHGNAILSKYDMTDFSVVEHTVGRDNGVTA